MEQQPYSTVVTILGQQVALGPLRRDLMESYVRWFNDIEVVRTWGVRRSPATLDEVEDWYKKATTDGRSVAFTLYEANSTRPVGYTMLMNINHFDRIADFDIIIGEKECWGQGYGTEATRLTLDYAFTLLSLHNIMLTVRSYNERGLRAYQRAGFQVIGRRREARRFGGRAYDLIYMDCIAPDFKSPVLHRFLPE